MAGEGDHSVALLAAVMAALKANARVAAFVGNRVYDNVPSRLSWPYLTLENPDSLSAFGSGDYEADDMTINVHVWSRSDNRSSTECRRLCAAVQSALHDADLNLGPSVGLAQFNRTSRRTFRDPDLITWHSVIAFEARVETLE